MQPWQGSESELRARLWYARDPSADAGSAGLKRLANRLLGNYLALKALQGHAGSSLAGGETAALSKFQATSEALAINPDFWMPYTMRATTALTLLDVGFYDSGIDQGFSQDGQPIAYGHLHCLADAGMGVLLAPSKMRPHAEFTLGWVLIEASRLPQMGDPSWAEEARLRLEWARDNSNDPSLADRCAQALEMIE